MQENEKKTKENFLEVIYNHGNANNRKLLLAISLFYGLSSLYIIGYPLWFKEPDIICHRKLGEIDSLCSEVEACKIGNYTIIRNSSLSFTSEKGLICEKAEIKRKTISFSLLGYILGMLVNMTFPITAKNRKDWIGVCCLIFSFGCMITLLFPNSMTAISYGLCKTKI